MVITHTPGKPLLVQVRIKFIEQGTSLSRWCINNGVDHSYAHRAITGTLAIPAAVKLRERILVAAGLMEQPSTTRKRKQA